MPPSQGRVVVAGCAVSTDVSSVPCSTGHIMFPHPILIPVRVFSVRCESPSLPVVSAGVILDTSNNSSDSVPLPLPVGSEETVAGDPRAAPSSKQETDFILPNVECFQFPASVLIEAAEIALSLIEAGGVDVAPAIDRLSLRSPESPPIARVAAVGGIVAGAAVQACRAGSFGGVAMEAGTSSPSEAAVQAEDAEVTADDMHSSLSGDPDVDLLDPDVWPPDVTSGRSSPSVTCNGPDVADLWLPPARVGAIFIDDWDDFPLPFEDIPPVDDI